MIKFVFVGARIVYPSSQIKNRYSTFKLYKSTNFDVIQNLDPFQNAALNLGCGRKRSATPDLG